MQSNWRLLNQKQHPRSKQLTINSMVRRAVVALRPVGLPGPVPPFAERKALLLGKKVDILAAGDLATVLQLAPDQTAAEFAVRVHDGLDVIQLPENCRNCNTHKQQPPGLRWAVKSLAQFRLQFNPQQKENVVNTIFIVPVPALSRVPLIGPGRIHEGRLTWKWGVGSERWGVG
jgi:hypothetical protein